ncbi:hypothetical protein EMIHUDRAFT_111367 [Emiliania huxleyi CCMP1516]|uniref:Helicase C-terminal domain-containing protein n=2 Tax=Emiliania huxleyi TaxID=2903 RepID=A0A0D3KEF3_EMIH1|nr:hypothetical protein EMIHUDRAFT_111367 [Emiliania huxleyi CCMP1516]EOD34138.1 hypothetical protein EMIHUDRAFT_111367 [Emiliania huxleyi CCMP1516]|eukprot:XP_005786567.1 hypothetical protein EMIHUDRAFT_111367 [Emiliania huxleyi CCMP1516]
MYLSVSPCLSLSLSFFLAAPPQAASPWTCHARARYCLPAREDLLPELLPLVTPSLLQAAALRRGDGVASACLPEASRNLLLQALADDDDDARPRRCSVMGLLASLCASLPYATLAAAEARGEAAALSPLPAEAGGPPPGLRRGVSVFSLVVPRLWPFMHRHPAADAGARRADLLDSWPTASAGAAAGPPGTAAGDGPPPLSVEGAEALAGGVFSAWDAALRVPRNAASRLRCHESRGAVVTAAAAVRRRRAELLIELRAAAAEAVIAIGSLPPKVSALINALMMILRTGAPTPQTRAGGSLAALLSLLRARPPSDSGHPNDKVVAKLCSLAAAAAALLLFPRVLATLLGPFGQGNDAGAAAERALAARTVGAFCAAPELQSRAACELCDAALPALAADDRPRSQLGATLAVRSAVEAMGMGLLPYAALVLPPLVRALASQAEESKEWTRVIGGRKPAPFQLPVPIYAELRPYQQEGARYVGELLEAIEYAGPPAKRAAMRPRLPAAALVVVSYETLRSDAAPLSAVSWDYLVLDEGHVIKNGSSKNDALELWSLFDFLMPGYLGQRRHFHSQYVKPISASYGASAGDVAHTRRGAKLLGSLPGTFGAPLEVLPFCLRRTKAAVLQDLPPKVIADRLVPLSAVQQLLYCAFAQSPAQGGVRRAIDKAAEGGGRRRGGCGKGGGGGSGDGGGGGGGDGSSEGGGGGEGAATVLHALQYLRKARSSPDNKKKKKKKKRKKVKDGLQLLDEAHPLRAQCEAAAAAEGCTLHSLAVAPKLEALRRRALRQLLAECGIGAADASAAESAAAAADDAALAGGGGGAAALAAHRALVFAQSASMLDRVEADLLAAHLPSVSHVRLDGRVAVARRGELVERFNSDPSIDLMLLTTAVGGLGLSLTSARHGLNLTSADTVIFLDHDWNPMRDMQAMANEESFISYSLSSDWSPMRHMQAPDRRWTAMDRAHRLGQKRSVSVFRLISRGTLEEKIMSLQRFKTHVLDLFELSPATTAAGAAPSAQASGGGEGGGGGGDGGSGGLQSLLSNVGSLWGSEEYEEEYDLDEFLDQLS